MITRASAKRAVNPLGARSRRHHLRNVPPHYYKVTKERRVAPRTNSGVRLAADKPDMHDAVAAAGVSEKPCVVTADREFPAQIA